MDMSSYALSQALWGGKSRRHSRRLAICASIAAFSGLAGCAFTPRGTSDEWKNLQAESPRYEPRFDQREIPELPSPATWQDVLSRSFLANGELEAAYFGWKAALQGVRAAGAWPNTDVHLGYQYEFSKDRMKTFDRMTFSAGFDPMENLSFPTKTMQAAKVALDEARVAGERFRVVKFEVQRQVLIAWADYVLQERALNFKRQDVALRRIVVESGAARVQAGARQRDLLESHLALQMAENDLRDMEAEREQNGMAINALMGRDPKAALTAPASHPPPREVPADDAALLVAAAEIFPEVVEFAREVEARQDALKLAQMRWIPDINPSLAFTGGIAQAIGIAVVLPTTIAEIRSQIEQAQSALRAAEARLRQSRFDRIGEYVSLLVMLRNAERQREFFRSAVLPLAAHLSADQSRAYETGAAALSELIESQRLLLEVQLTIAQAEAAIDKAIVEIECCLGTDLEMLAPQTQPAIPSPPSTSSESPVASAKSTSISEVVHHE